jgi:hypothetical protein
MALLQRRLAQGNSAGIDIEPPSAFREIPESPRNILRTQYPQAYQIARVSIDV